MRQLMPNIEKFKPETKMSTKPVLESKHESQNIDENSQAGIL